MVSLYFVHVSLHSSALPIPVNQTPKLTKSSFTNALFTMCIPILFRCFSYPCVFRIMQAKWALTELLHLQVGVERELCVVCPAPAATSSTSTELLHRQKHPPNQTSRLLAVFRRLRSPSLPPAPTATASPSSTQQMNLRSTRVHKRGRTLLFLLLLCIA